MSANVSNKILLKPSLRIVIAAFAFAFLSVQAHAFYFGAGANLSLNANPFYMSGGAQFGAGIGGGFGGGFGGGYPYGGYAQPAPMWIPSTVMQPYLRPVLNYQMDYMPQTVMQPYWPQQMYPQQMWPQQMYPQMWPGQGYGPGHMGGPMWHGGGGGQHPLMPWITPRPFNAFPAIPQWTPRVRAYRDPGGGGSTYTPPSRGGGLTPPKSPEPARPPAPIAPPPPPPAPIAPPAPPGPILKCPPVPPKDTENYESNNYNNAWKPCCVQSANFDENKLLGKPSYILDDMTLDQFVCVKKRGENRGHQVYLSDRTGNSGIVCKSDGSIAGPQVVQIPEDGDVERVPCAVLESEGRIEWSIELSTLVCEKPALQKNDPEALRNYPNYLSDYAKARRERLGISEGYNWNYKPRCPEGKEFRNEVNPAYRGRPRATTPGTTRRRADGPTGPTVATTTGAGTTTGTTANQGTEATVDCNDEDCKDKKNPILRAAEDLKKAIAPNTLVQGSRAVMSALLQSCHAGEPDARVATPSPQCKKDVMGILMISRRTIKTSPNIADSNVAFERKEGNATLDAFGFIRAAMATTGLKFSPGNRSAGDLLKTGPSNYKELIDSAAKGDSCLSIVPPSDHKQIRAGDIVAIPNVNGGGTAIVIDSVKNGDDPFGVNKLNGSCGAADQVVNLLQCNDKVKVENFQFYVTAPGSDPREPLKRMLVGDYIKGLKSYASSREVAAVTSSFCDMAIRSCTAKAALNRSGRIPSLPPADSSYRQIRHNNSEVPSAQEAAAGNACRFPSAAVPPLENTTCLEKCFKENLNSTRVPDNGPQA